MAYRRKKYSDIVFFDENPGNNAFNGRLDFGKIGEGELKKYLEVYFAHKEKSDVENIKIWESEVFQRDVMGISPLNKFDTALGDVIITREYQSHRKVFIRFDAKWSRDDQNATVSFHGDPTCIFNSYEETFYVTKKNKKWYAIWGQDLVMLTPDRFSNTDGKKWWSKDTLSKFLIPLDEVLDVFYRDDIELLQKCDLVESLRDKYNHVKPKTIKMIEENQKLQSNPSKGTTLKKDSIKKSSVEKTVILKSKSPGYYAALPIKEILNAEAIKGDTIFIMNYCPAEGEPEKAPVKVSFNKIRPIWKTLVRGNNAFIKSIDLKEYFNK